MATNNDNDLIGYDPLVWMEGNTGSVEESLPENDVNEPEAEIADLQPEANDISEAETIEEFENIEESAAVETIDSALVEAEDDELSQVEDVSLQDNITDDVKDGICEQVQEVPVVSSEIDLTVGSQVDLDAALSIQTVAALYEQLKNCLAVHDEIEINASDVASIDTATLQLLVSLKKDEAKLQKKVTIIYPSPRFVESARLLGLSDILGVHEM